MRLLIPATLLLVSACASQQVIYSGYLQPIAGVCDPAARAELTRRGKAVLFVPNSGTITLIGHQDGAVITASTTLVGADKKPYRLILNGQSHDQAIQGIYETPRCRYKVSLRLIGG